MPALAFGCYIIRAGRYKEWQLEELLAIGINVDAAPATAELLQLAYAQNFANHFESLFGSVCRLNYFILFSFNCCCCCCCFCICFWFTLRIWHRVCVFFIYFLLFSCLYFVSHRHNNNNENIYVDFWLSLFQFQFLFFVLLVVVVFIVLIYCALQFACLVYSSSSSCERQRSSRSSSTWI